MKCVSNPAFCDRRPSRTVSPKRGRFLFNLFRAVRIRLRHLVAAPHQRHRVCHAGNELPRRRLVLTQVEFMPLTVREIIGYSVRLEERQCKLVRRDPDPDVAQIAQRRKAVLRNLIDIECKFHLHMLVPASA